MKSLLAHQFLKDLRQTWILWTVWLLLTALQFAIAAWNVSSSDFLAQGSYAQLAGMLPLFQRLLLCVLIPALILQEPAVGTNAFWLTRPMPRGTVLWSKLLALLILVLLPTLGQCTVLLAHQVLPGDVFLAGLQILLHELSWIAVLMMLAALSPNFTRYLVALVLVLGLQFLADWAATILVLAKATRAGSDTSLLLSPTLINSREVAADLLKILLCLGVLCFQYTTRRTRRAIALAAAAILFPFLIARFWPWAFLPSSEKQVATTKADSTPFRIIVSPQSHANGSLGSLGKVSTVWFGSSISFQNSGPARAVAIIPLHSEFTLPDGKKLTSQPLARSFSFPQEAPLEGTSETINALLDNLPMLLCKNTYGSSDPSFLSLSKEDADAYGGRRGKLTLRLKVQLYGYRIASAWPLREESVVRHGSERLILSKIQKQENALQINLQDRTVQLQLRPTPLLGQIPIKMYALVNPSRQESILASIAPNFGNMMSYVASSIFSNLARFGVPSGGNGIESLGSQSILFGSGPFTNPKIELPVDLNTSWLEGAKLLQLESVPEGEFETTVTVEDFRLARPNENTYFSSEPENQSEEKLKSLTLPPHPSRSETWLYIQNILQDFPNSVRSDDPQIKLLTQVGPQNADLLFFALYNNPYGYSPNHLTGALNQMDLRGTPCKPMLLKFLSNQQFGNTDSLIESVRKNHWESDAEPILLERLKQANTSGNWIRPEWVLALASLRDPATYPTLLEFARNRFQRNQDQINDLRAIPGPLISSMVADLWKQARDIQKKEGNLLLTASSWGIADALEQSTEILRTTSGTSKEEQNLKNQAREAFKMTTARPDGLLDVELAGWFDTNKANLTFDPHLGRFLLHARPVVDQQAGWPIPADYVKKLGELAANGEMAAIDDLADALSRLTEGLDPVRDRDRIRDLRGIAWNAFNVLREEAVKHSEVFRVLEYANGKAGMNLYFVPGAYSAAATEGNQTALDALTHYKEHQWSLTDALNNLRGAAGKNNPQAVEFLLTVFADPSITTLPNAKETRKSLEEALRAAANAGNAQALSAYKTLQNQQLAEK